MLGPTNPSRAGEISVALAKALGIPSSPVNGGSTNLNAALYEIYPGTPALVNGKSYQLQDWPTT